ncbi:cytochrome P450 [Bacillus sp. FSL W7-1360]
MANKTMVELFSDRFHQCPYARYKEVRAETSFAKTKLPYGDEVWMAYTYEAVEKVLKEERFSKNAHAVFDNADEYGTVLMGNSMLFVDPPDHRRLRMLVQKAFTPRAIANLRPWIEVIARELADQMKGKQEVDLIEAYAFPLPIIVICELLGVPAADRDRFQVWSHALVDLEEDTSGEQKMMALLEEFREYLVALITQRRDNPREDMVSELIRAEEEGDRLSIEELIGVIMLLIVAGHETTVNLIGNNVHALLTHRQEWERLQQDPARVPAALEELLRYNGPVEFSTERWAKESFTFMGQQIEKGDMVIASLASAAHDEKRITTPDTLDLTREKSPHLAFGSGIHYCLGAPLARLEGEIALTMLLERFPNMQLAVDPAALSWRKSLVIRGLHKLPVVLAK